MKKLCTIVTYNKLIIILVLLVTNNVRADEASVGNHFANLFNSQDILFENYIINFRLREKLYYWYNNSPDRFSEAKQAFKENLVLIDYFNKYITTAKFGVNKYSGISFDKFIQRYTGFNSTGLTDEGVVEFDPKYAGRIPVEMDWTRLLTIYEMSYCKNSYVYSALSKYCTACPNYKCYLLENNPFVFGNRL